MRKGNAILAALLAVFMLNGASARYAREAAEKDSRAMKAHEQEYGKANPKAAPELSRFAFLIGMWRCEVKLKREDATWENLKATWEGRYILDGYAIADEYRMTTAAGELFVLGVNLRSYDAKKKAWNMKWLNALSGTWVDLGPEELGGVEITDKTIRLSMKGPGGGHALERATYSNISAEHFTWRGERSNDGKTWEEFIVIEAYRSGRGTD